MLIDLPAVQRYLSLSAGKADSESRLENNFESRIPLERINTAVCCQIFKHVDRPPPAQQAPKDCHGGKGEGATRNRQHPPGSWEHPSPVLRPSHRPGNGTSSIGASRRCLCQEPRTTPQYSSGKCTSLPNVRGLEILCLNEQRIITVKTVHTKTHTNNRRIPLTESPTVSPTVPTSKIRKARKAP